jgi:hypothetical protein
MEEIITRLYVGGDDDYERIKGKAGWSVLRCCKEGPGGHRETVGYKTPGAPKGPKYLSASAGDRMALNYIDPHDPSFIQREMLQKGLEFIDACLRAGDKVLVACNHGHSRGPTTCLMYLRAVGEMPHNFVASERMFRTLYPDYNPGIGMRQFARMHWDELDDVLRKVT